MYEVLDDAVTSTPSRSQSGKPLDRDPPRSLLFVAPLSMCRYRDGDGKSSHALFVRYPGINHASVHYT